MMVENIKMNNRFAEDFLVLGNRLVDNEIKKLFLHVNIYGKEELENKEKKFDVIILNIKNKKFYRRKTISQLYKKIKKGGVLVQEYELDYSKKMYRNYKKFFKKVEQEKNVILGVKTIK